MRGRKAETIVVTGASSGIGRELAIQLAETNKEIWLVGRNRDRLEEVAQIVRGNGAIARIAELDLSDLDAAGRFLEETFPPGNHVDELYLVAAITMFGEVKDTLLEDWQKIYRTNLLSAVQWSVHFYRNMVSRKRGRIVIISSLAAYAGYPIATAYATMKAGLLGLFRSLWHEGKAHGVAFHLASPGYVDTGIYKSAIFRNTTYDRTMAQIRSLGFKILPADTAARIILRRIRRGESQFAFPTYASLMKWTAPRMPFLIGRIHDRIVNEFRKAP